MTKEMPEWLKGYYNQLWEKHKNESFTFQIAMKELDISQKMITKTLLELEKKGFLSKERSPIDYRAKVYRLISPEDIKFAVGFYLLIEKEKIEKLTLTDKLVLIEDKLPYAITGSNAAYHYHNYINPPKTVEIKIHLSDAGKWIAFLTDEKTRVFLGDVIESRKINNYVKLLHSDMALDSIRTKTKEGYYIEKPEFLMMDIVESHEENKGLRAKMPVAPIEDMILMKLMTERPRDHFDAIAMIIDSFDKIDLLRFAKICKESGLRSHIRDRLESVLADTKRGFIKKLWREQTGREFIREQEVALKDRVNMLREANSS